MTAQAAAPTASAVAPPPCSNRFDLGATGLRIPYCSNKLLGTLDTTVKRAVVVIHGTGRNGPSYYGSVNTAAIAAGLLNETIIIAPHFLIEEDIDAHAPGNDVPYWTEHGWKQGDRSIISTGRNPRSTSLSSFEVIDYIAAALADHTIFPNLRTVVIAGHSAGGQFVNRYAGANPEPNHTSYVVANPSSYLYLNPRRALPPSVDLFWARNWDYSRCTTYNDYKYGLEGLNWYTSSVGAAEIRDRYIRRSVTYLLGLDDNDPQHDELDRTCAAMTQGRHRLERGETYFNNLNQFYGEYVQDTHRIAYVPGVGHSANDMFTSPEGVQVLFPALPVDPITKPPLPPIMPSTIDTVSPTCAAHLLLDIGVSRNRNATAGADAFSHYPGAVLAGTTSQGSIELARPVPITGPGRTITFTSSTPALVTVPAVTIPPGTRSGRFSMTIPDAGAGGTVSLTAHGDVTKQATVTVPNRRIRTISLGTREGFQSTILGVAARGRHVFATHYFGKANSHESPVVGDLVCLDAASMAELSRVPVGHQPRRVAVDPNTGKIYVVNYGSGSYSLSILRDTASGRPEPVVELTLGQVPIDIALNTRTRRVFVSNPNQQKIHVIDGASDTPLPPILVGPGLGGIAVDDVENSLFVTQSVRTGGSELRAFTLIQGRADGGYHVVPPTPVGVPGHQPVAIAVRHSTNRIYVACLGAPGVPPGIAVHDRLSSAALTFVRTVANPHAIAVHPTRDLVLVGTDAGLQVLDGATNTVISTAPANPIWGLVTSEPNGIVCHGDAITGLLRAVPAPDATTVARWT